MTHEIEQPGNPAVGAESPAGCDEQVASDRRKNLAECAVAPALRHAHLIGSFSEPVMGNEANWTDNVEALGDKMRDVARGNKRTTSNMLTAQAITLDTVFTEMLRRAGNNMGQFPDAAERYMRMAMKAQAQSRATLDTLARLHQPREQTVKHVHVGAGGQAVVADEFHHHAQRGSNAESTDQAQAAHNLSECAAMLGQDPAGNGVPIASSPWKEPVQDARRREGERSTKGE